MIFFCAGLPGRFAEWCDALLSRLVEHHFGQAEIVLLDRIEELAAAAIRSKALNLIVCSRQAAPRLQSEILQAGRPFLIALGNPFAALRKLVARDGYDLPGATRAVANGCAAMLTIARGSPALVLRPADAVNARTVASTIAKHLNLDIDQDVLRRVVEHLPDAELDPEEAEVQAWRDELPERERAVIAGVLDPYVHCFDGEPLERVVWEPELFFMNEDGAGLTPGPLTRPVDLTGRPRPVVYGPYVSLPPGPWSATVVLGFSPEAAGMNFFIEITAGATLAQSRVTADREQVVEIQLAFTIDESIDHPIEIRIWTERSAIDGRLALGYAAITPQRTIPAETRQRLVDALHL